MTRDSLAIAIEALSWMAYEGIGERTALFRASKQLGIGESSELREAHKLIMETCRFQNRLDSLVKSAAGGTGIESAPHGIISFLRILAYVAYIDTAPRSNLLRIVKWARDILGWKELQPFEIPIALIASGKLNEYNTDLSEFEKLALQTAHPAWFVERTTRCFGRDFAIRMLRRNLSQLPTYVRMNPLAPSVHDHRGEVEGSRIPQLEGVLKVEKSSRISTKTQLIRSGAVVIQDLASVVAGLVSGVEPGQKVLDICAAPGNKTSHLAALMNNEGEICSIDISESRLSHWKDEMKRTGVTIAQPLMADASALPLRMRADVILVDPPCSNTGVFARNPSVKWRTTTSHVNDYAENQYSILSALGEHVEPGGTIVYCTCSVLPEENEFVIERFLKQSSNFEIARQTPFVGSPGLRGFDKCQRFYPHLHDCNGYFIAKLRRMS